MRKTVYLTGGTGFVGQRFIPAWLARSDSHQLVVQTRTPERYNSVQPNCRFVSSLLELPKDIENYILINLAGAPIADARWNLSRKTVLLQSRVQLTHTLFNAASQVGMPSHVINASAVGFYGTGEEECDESSAAGQGFAADLCRQWEGAAGQFEAFAPLLCMRFGVILGAGGGALGKLLPIYRMGMGGAIGSGNQWLSWVHLDDVVNALIMAVERVDWSGPMNVVAPNPVRQKDFAKTLAGVLQRPSFMRTPALLLRLIYGEMADELLISGQRVVPKALADKGFEFAFPDLAPALRNIILPLKQ